MTPLKVRLRPIENGAVAIQLSCRCATVTRTVTSWESSADVIADLLEEHHHQAPACRHPSSTSDPSAGHRPPARAPEGIARIEHAGLRGTGHASTKEST